MNGTFSLNRTHTKGKKMDGKKMGRRERSLLAYVALRAGSDSPRRVLHRV